MEDGYRVVQGMYSSHDILRLLMEVVVTIFGMTSYIHNGSWFQLVQGMYTPVQGMHSNICTFRFSGGGGGVRNVHLYVHIIFDDMLYAQ